MTLRFIVAARVAIALWERRYPDELPPATPDAVGDAMALAVATFFVALALAAEWIVALVARLATRRQRPAGRGVRPGPSSP